MGFFHSIRDSLKKTRDSIVNKVQTIIKTKKKIDQDMLDEIEEVLIAADLGMEPTMEVIDELTSRIKKQGYIKSEDLFQTLRNVVSELTSEAQDFFKVDKLPQKPYVIMVVGVNGVGKTTTIGKMAHRFKEAKAKVIIAASDTFRAAAIDQLEIWAERSQVDIVKHKDGADPAAVAFDALNAAIAREVDVVIIDTAGRLHTKTNLMEELKKIRRICKKVLPEAPHETLLVIDAITGQNGLMQAKVFKEAAKVTGIVLAKLDGTAKGGIVLSIKRQLNLPIVLVGTGEGIDDLREFNADEFAAGLVPILSDKEEE